MSASHHGAFPERNPVIEEMQKRLIERFMAQVEGKAARKYSAGRISADDDGDLALAIATDLKAKTIIIRFGKPVEWIGLGAAEATYLLNQLKDRLVELGEPVVMTIGSQT